MKATTKTTTRPGSATHDRMAMELSILGLALAWDRYLGEPPADSHPVVEIGNLAKRFMGEPTGNEKADFEHGLGVAASVTAGSAAACAAAIQELRRAGPAAELVGGAFLLKTTFAVRSMNEHALAVERCLAHGDIEGARHAVSMIVSRDVSGLDEEGIANTCVGSISENITDSIVAPLLAYALFGVPGALAYRAANTLDAMYGYRGKYEFLGKGAARLDDALNYIPARIAGPAVAVAAGQLKMDATSSWQTMLNEHSRTLSPNSGWTIGASAGALGIEIEKVGQYRLGPTGTRTSSQDISRSLMLFNRTALIAAAAAAFMIVARNTGRVLRTSE